MLALPYMPRTVYVSVSEINGLQTQVMEFINKWVHEEKTPVPLKEIITGMKNQKIDRPSVIYSLKILIEKGYIRRSLEVSNKTSFVQLRGLNA